jgi:hypothetical protein
MYLRTLRPKSKLRYDRRSVSQSVFLLWPDFCFLTDSCGILDAGRPLWREDGSVIYSCNCFWALPEQSLSGPSPPEFMTIFYYLIRDFLTWWARSPYLCPPRNKVAQLYPRALGSLFVASYDSEDYGGVIATRLHMGWHYIPGNCGICKHRHQNLEFIVYSSGADLNAL